MKENPGKHADSKVLYEHVNLSHLPKYFYGGFWVRTFAYLFDLWIIRSLTAILLNLSVYRIFGREAAESFWIRILTLLIFLAYFTVTTYFFQGQTLGKILFRLRVVALHPAPSFLNTILIRELAGKVIFYYFPYIAVLLVFTPKRQHVVDFLADTAVVNEGKWWEYRQLAGKNEPAS